MEKAIPSELARIARANGVRVLYAVESGSLAWGFESVDCDYDVRFIYVHSRDWYFSVRDRRDVIEEVANGDLDLSGWELRKAPRLLRKSNPPLMERLRSQNVYLSIDMFVNCLRGLATKYYSLERCFLHYLHMAEGNARSYFTSDAVPHKKYLYVLRPLLACLWIERGPGPVPMEFIDLADRVG